MDINLLEPAMSQIDIDRAAHDLRNKIGRLESTKKSISLLYLLFLCIICVAMNILGDTIGNRQWDASLLLALLPISLLVFQSGIIPKALLLFISVLVSMISLVYLGGTNGFYIALVCVFIYGTLSDMADIRISRLQRQLEGLKPAQKTCCLKIKNWLANSVIKEFRDSVVREGRLFIVAEVIVMEKYYISDINNKQQDADKRKEDEACKQVYLGALS